MSNSITAKEAPLAEIFNGNMLFNIPPYQRPYSWENEQIEELFSDLLSASESVTKKEKLKDAAPYFLGSIVLVASEEKLFDVIDGQQRLTTITLLLAALKEIASDEGNEDQRKNVLPLLLQEANDFTGDPCEYRLTVRDEDAEFFRDTIIDGERNDPPQTDSQRLMLENKEADLAGFFVFKTDFPPISFRYFFLCGAFLAAGFLGATCFLTVTFLAALGQIATPLFSMIC